MDDESPWRMTCDVYDVDTDTIHRYQVTGHYNGWPDGPPERTLEEIARYAVLLVQLSSYFARMNGPAG